VGAVGSLSKVAERGLPLLGKGIIGVEVVQLRPKPFTNYSAAHKGIASDGTGFQLCSIQSWRRFCLPPQFRILPDDFPLALTPTPWLCWAWTHPKTRSCPHSYRVVDDRAIAPAFDGHEFRWKGTRHTLGDSLGLQLLAELKVLISSKFLPSPLGRPLTSPYNTISRNTKFVCFVSKGPEFCHT
jgi:hypothetical protein